MATDGHVKPGDLKGLSLICHEQRFLSGSSLFKVFSSLLCLTLLICQCLLSGTSDAMGGGQCSLLVLCKRRGECT